MNTCFFLVSFHARIRKNLKRGKREKCVCVCLWSQTWLRPKNSRSEQKGLVVVVIVVVVVVVIVVVVIVVVVIVVVVVEWKVCVKFLLRQSGTVPLLGYSHNNSGMILHLGTLFYFNTHESRDSYFITT